MIKIRLHGLPEDINEAKKIIDNEFDVVASSGNYADRGQSKLVRCYLEAQIPSQTSDAITPAELSKAYEKSKKENLI